MRRPGERKDKETVLYAVAMGNGVFLPLARVMMAG